MTHLGQKEVQSKFIVLYIKSVICRILHVVSSFEDIH